MRIGVLTSSRADFGIYLPLLEKLEADPDFNLLIIAFGTHCSVYHGETIQEIEESGFKKIDAINSLLISDDEQSISTSYGLTVIKFADYWSYNSFDLVFCLGDRFEMSAAVQAGIPFGIRFAHIHGGEITLGAIDNIYRHQLSIASHLHFTSTVEYAQKVKNLTNTDELVYNVGALSLNGLDDMKLLDEKNFRNQYKIPKGEFLLTTFHPETVDNKKNKEYAIEMKEALKTLAQEFILIITMPNADTLGSIFRKIIRDLKESLPNRIVLIESFGKRDYFSAMKYSSLLLGNSSSGIIEAASFNKFVVNVGSRQKGRTQSENIINCKFDKDSIIESVKKAKKLGQFKGENVYYQKNTANQIVKTIKLYNETL